MSSELRNIAKYVAWPGLLVSCCAILALGFALDSEVLFFNLSYVWIVVWLFLLESKMPYEARWQESDGQLIADLSHTLLNKGLVQFLIVQLMALGVLGDRSDSATGQLSLPVQVLVGLVISEIGLYGAHRLAHEWPLLWRCHAVHHSVKKLWLINTGRFHFIDSIASVAASIPFLLISGISMDAVVWVSAITAYIGILTHCNVDVDCGPLNYIFNTPNLHRWHHSTVREEGNTNYGENIMLWDILLGTFLYKKGQGVENIGIREYMPLRFVDQLALPFRWKFYQAQQDRVPD